MISERKVYLGISGTGKSSLMLEDLRNHPRVVVFNTLGETSASHGAAYEQLEQAETFLGLINRLYDNDAFFRLAYIPEGQLELEAEFDRVCEAILACQNLVFAVDEIHLFAKPTKLPLPLTRIVSTGRKQGISFFCAAQRAASIHPLIRSQASEIVSFQQSEPSDMVWLRECLGELADQVTQLSGHEFIRWKRGETGPQTADTLTPSGAA